MIGRVLHVITNLELGGAQLSVTGIVRGLHARGIDVHLAFSSRGGSRPGSHDALAAQLRAAGVPLHDIPAMRRELSLRDPIAAVDLARLVHRLAPSIVHTHASKAGLLGRSVAALLGTPIVIHSVRGWSFQGRRNRVTRALYASSERALAHATDHFASVSHVMVDVARAHKIHGDYSVIRSGIDTHRFQADPGVRTAARQALGIDRDTPVIGTVTRFAPSKAPHDFVSVAARVARRIAAARFVIVGDGPDRDAVFRSLATSGLASRTRWLGERLDVDRILPAFDVFVSTARWEGLPRVVVEAALAGIPVVATDVGGTREIIGDHGGILCPSGAVDALAEAVLRGLQGATPVCSLADHDIEHVIDRHVSLYRELATNRARVSSRCYKAGR